MAIMVRKWFRGNKKIEHFLFDRMRYIVLNELYNKLKVCVVYIEVKDQNEDVHIGTGFHIGDGYIVTAAHVVKNNIIMSIGNRHCFEDVHCLSLIFADNELIDLAILETDFSLRHYMELTTIVGVTYEKTDHIEIGGHLDDWIGDDFVLSKALLMGYPPIPLSKNPELVATEVEVNAIIDKYTAPHPHFIISSIPRGGFSGGPVISEYGFLLGIMTESLISGDEHYQLGYASAISVEPLLNILNTNGIKPAGGKWALEELYS